MSIDDRELAAIMFLAIRVRKATAGAGVWDEPGLHANLRKLQTRNLHMTVEHVLRHAADPKAKSPGVLLGAYTPDAPVEDRTFHPPKVHEECRQHPGQRPPPFCASHRTDELTEREEHVEPMDSEQALKVARAALDGAR